VRSEGIVRWVERRTRARDVTILSRFGLLRRVPQRKRLTMGLLLLGVSILFAAYAVLLGGAGWTLMWPAGAFALVGVAYLARRPSVFGKADDGTLSLARSVVLAPYLSSLWLTWQITRLLGKEAAHVELCPDIFIGRRLLHQELPPGMASIVDLTSEFAEPRKVVQGRQYYSFRVLDAGAPPPEVLAQWADRLVDAPRPMLIHCAQGHGRTATMASALLVRSGAASSVEEALELVWRVRPAARPRDAQVEAVRCMPARA